MGSRHVDGINAEINPFLKCATHPSSKGSRGNDLNSMLAVQNLTVVSWWGIHCSILPARIWHRFADPRVKKVLVNIAGTEPRTWNRVRPPLLTSNFRQFSLHLSFSIFIWFFLPTISDLHLVSTVSLGVHGAYLNYRRISRYAYTERSTWVDRTSLGWLC